MSTFNSVVDSVLIGHRLFAGKWLAHFVELQVVLAQPLILVRLYSLLCWIVDVQGVL
jgi:hypothetical protein